MAKFLKNLMEKINNPIIDHIKEYPKLYSWLFALAGVVIIFLSILKKTPDNYNCDCDEKTCEDCKKDCKYACCKNLDNNIVCLDRDRHISVGVGIVCAFICLFISAIIIVYVKN